MLVYILFEDGEVIAVYSNESYARSDAILYNLKDWHILAREYK